MRIKKAVIPAAGLGTRFLPATKAIPKELIPIVDKPMIQFIVEECVASGIREILFITSSGKDAILDHFDRSLILEETLERTKKAELLKVCREVSSLVEVSSVRQKETLGLGHAVLMAKSWVGSEAFAVLLGDDLVENDEVACTAQLVKVFQKFQKSVIGVMQVPREDVSKYGVIDGQATEVGTYQVRRMVEKPKVDQSPSNLACPGRYVLTPEIFSYLEKAKPGALGEIQLTDALDALAAENKLLAYEFEGRRFDTGDKLGFLEATLHFALKRSDLREPFLKILKRYADQK